MTVMADAPRTLERGAVVRYRTARGLAFHRYGPKASIPILSISNATEVELAGGGTAVEGAVHPAGGQRSTRPPGGSKGTQAAPMPSGAPPPAAWRRTVASAARLRQRPKRVSPLLPPLGQAARSWARRWARRMAPSWVAH